MKNDHKDMAPKRGEELFSSGDHKYEDVMVNTVIVRMNVLKA